MRLIPAIDIINGQCVRLSKGDYDTRKIYNENPVEVAKNFEANGITYLHVVDLDGAKQKKIINHKTLENICTQTNLRVDFGGGISSFQDLKIAFECGVKQVTLGSIAVREPEKFEEWLAIYGQNKIILGADCRNRKIATAGWLETSEIDVVDFIQMHEKKGVKYVVCTDISKDGMLQGTSNELYQEILGKTQIHLVASGGVSSIHDLMQLQKLGCEGVIIGKAIYEGKITLQELKQLG